MLISTACRPGKAPGRRDFERRVLCLSSRSSTMHSSYARVNNVSATISTIVMVLLGTIALSSFVFTPYPTGSLEVTSLKV
jgi:hypothetical protein